MSFRYELSRGEGERFVIDSSSGIAARVRGDNGEVTTVTVLGPVDPLFAASMLVDLFTAVDPWEMMAESVSAP